MKKFNLKKFMYGTGSVIVAAVVIAAVILFNFIISSLTDKFSLKYDFTEDKIYELSDSTVEFVKKVSVPINMYYFVDNVTITSNITETLTKIAALNKNIKYSIVSADKNPTLAQKYTTSDTKLGTYTIVVDNGKNYKVINYEDFFGYNPLTQKKDILVVENKVVSAINTVSRDKKITVGFTTGHGEDASEVMKKCLKDDNITVTEAALSSDEFAKQCDVIIIAAPMADFTADEINRLDAYIKNGGGVQVYFMYNSDQMPKLYSYLGECGIEVGTNLVFEGNSTKVVGSAPYVFTTTLNEHDITKNMIANGSVSIAQLSRTVTPLWEGRNGFAVTSLQKTGSKASAQSSVSGETEKTGELSLCAVSKYSGENGKGGSILVSGSFVSYEGSYAEYNSDLLLSATVWMSGGEESFDIAPKFLSLTALKISQLSIVLWGLAVIFVIPFAIFIWGLFIWFRRRNL